MLTLKEHNHYYYPECHKDYLFQFIDSESALKHPFPLCFGNNDEAVCFNAIINSDADGINDIKLETSYFIGLHYIKEWNLPVLIEPKLNIGGQKLDFYKMLSDALIEPENFDHLDGLMDIDFKSEWIEVPPNSQVELTPFLVIQFLMAVKRLVKKGLKKSYYIKKENLKGRVKGKILVGEQVKQNLLKHRLTHTVCSFQEFGFDTPENRFIKYVLQFVHAHLANYEYDGFKTQLKELLSYNLAAFHQVGEESFTYYSKKETNPFFKIYNTVFDLGNQILKLISHSYEKSTQEIRKYPPHWIDMSKLFELYVFKKLREKFPKQGEVMYHVKAHYQELDYLIQSGDFKAVVDAKYKPRYANGNPSKDDARQLSGYARLERVYSKLKIEDDITIPIYFIYPKELVVNQDENSTDSTEETSAIFSNGLVILKDNLNVRAVSSYRKMFLQEIHMPIIVEKTD